MRSLDVTRAGDRAHAELESLERVEVHTIDSFQGAESEIVLISLVRSNHPRQPTARRRKRVYWS